MDNKELMDMIKKAQKMIDSNEVPEEIKEIANQMQNNNNSNEKKVNTSSSNYNNFEINNQKRNNFTPSNQNFNINTTSKNESIKDNNYGFNKSNNNIDMNNVIKLLNGINFNSDDDLTRLLFALKPYLRNERKEKIDEYVKLIKLGKMAELFDKLSNSK